MRSQRYFAAAAAFCLALLAGCGGETGSTAERSVQEGKSLQSRTIVDMADEADTLQKLAEQADWIAKIQVESLSTVERDTAHTQIVPKVLETYKGSYDGQTLDISGGILPYAETKAYQSTDRHESGDETALFYACWSENYVPQEGDVLLFFGDTQNSANTYYELYSYQGMFLLEDGSYTNQALRTGTHKLADDLQKLQGAAAADIPETFTRTENGFRYTFENWGTQTVAVPEQSMEDAIKTYLGEAL